MAETKKEEIHRFIDEASEEDFERLSKKLKDGTLALSFGRDRSRHLLRRIQGGYYWTFLLVAILLAAVTLYMVTLNEKLFAGIGVAVTVLSFFSFWRSITPRVLKWTMEEKKNFDYAYYTGVITVKKGGEEYSYPEDHWKDAL